MNNHTKQTFTQDNLEELTFQDAEFTNCLFQGCNFTDYDLSDCMFSKCSFVRCNLSNVSIEDSQFEKVLFQKCKIMGIAFGTVNEFQASFKFDECKISFCSFNSIDLPHLQCINCTIHNTDFVSANLKNGSFEDSEFKDCRFQQAELSNVSFKNARGYQINPTQNTITGAVFSMPEAMSLLGEFRVVID